MYWSHFLDKGYIEKSSQVSSLLAKKVNLAMLIPAWFYVKNAI